MPPATAGIPGYFSRVEVVGEMVILSSDMPVIFQVRGVVYGTSWLTYHARLLVDDRLAPIFCKHKGFTLISKFYSQYYLKILY